MSKQTKGLGGAKMTEKFLFFSFMLVLAFAHVSAQQPAFEPVDDFIPKLFVIV